MVESRAAEATGKLRVGEVLLLGFFASVAVAALFSPLGTRERVVVWTINLVAGSGILLLARHAGRERSLWLATLRDWLPCVLILVAYRESGLFWRPDPQHRLDLLFVRLDDLLLENRWVLGLLGFCSPWLQRYLEFSYFLCYPLVPLGVGALYLARRRARWSRNPVDLERAINRFWTATLLAVLTCYVMYPFFPLTPPRVLFHDVPGGSTAPLLRGINRWLLDAYSVQACLFPSAHVAAAVAMAPVIRACWPRLGTLFWIAAASIAAATVYGRYHYAADALAGALVGVAAYLISSRIHRA